MRVDARKNHERILEIASDIVTKDGAEASLRDIARKAGVGLGTLYRHFPSREALLEALLRASLDQLTAKARELEASGAPDEALVAWLREVVSIANSYRDVISAMVTAIEDTGSALHAACTTMKAAGARLLARAQAEGLARADIDGVDLFALVSALAWLGDQPALAQRAEHLFGVLADAILVNRGAAASAGNDGPGPCAANLQQTGKRA